MFLKVVVLIIKMLPCIKIKIVIINNLLYTKIKMVHIEFYQSVVILNQDSQLNVKVVVKVEM